jgi:hypothetical protein
MDEISIEELCELIRQDIEREWRDMLESERAPRMEDWRRTSPCP